MSTDRYVSPLSERYASKEMQYIFSPDMKFRTWRRLWIALAETEKELGLNITQEQIDELKAHAEDINYDVAKERERQVRHDVTRCKPYPVRPPTHSCGTQFAESREVSPYFAFVPASVPLLPAPYPPSGCPNDKLQILPSRDF